MKYSRYVFLVAGIYGLLAIIPQYFTEQKVGQDFPPAITHPEFYYGFIGVTVAWQVLFLVLASDPVRYRIMMVPAIIEKVSFGFAVIVLFAGERVSSMILLFACIDLVLAVLFLSAFIKTRASTNSSIN
jgi:hypothetical protein